MIRKRRAVWLILVLVTIAIKIFSLFPSAVEKYYAVGVYPLISQFLRLVFGWLPFSVGDILYALAAIYIVFAGFIFMKRLFQKKMNKAFIIRCAKRILFVGICIYIVFNLFWGLNYNRRGIAFQLGLDVQQYNTEDLVHLVSLIVSRLNELDSPGRVHRADLSQIRSGLFPGAVHAYKLLAQKDKFFKYSPSSVKPSFFGYVGDYLGFTGYYNPFSGEAQVNTTVPMFVQPFTTCHEIGHQLGYAKESEANFAGYLSAKSSDDPTFQYSVYFDLYEYAASELYLRDSTLLKPFREQLKPDIRADYRTLLQFYRKYSNPLEPYIRRLYGNYLKANEQPQGILSYNEVIAWLVAYGKKYGFQSI